MGWTIHRVAAECKFCEALTVEALGRVIPSSVVHAAVVRAAPRTGRVRKLTWEVTLWLVLALHLFPRQSIPAVLRQLAHGQRLVWPDPNIILPGASALVYRRYHLGVRPVAGLFHAVCRPLATARTVGAFRFGRRLMGLDGTVECVPDTPANARAFGRRASQRGPSVYPQVLAVYVVELGTHAIVDAGFWPGPSSEHRAARRLVRALDPDMLVLWDAGFHSVELLRAVHARGAAVLGRLPAHVQPRLLRHLPDGSALVYLRPSGAKRGQPEAGVRVRLVRYTLRGSGEVIRLVTTLLNPTQAPASALAAAYHERWEIELTLDELDTHQRLATRTLRSLRPVGVLQELYGLLLAHYVVRAVLHAAACQHDRDPDRLSFTRARELVCAAIPDFQLVAPRYWPALYARLLADLAHDGLPVRQPRAAPRAVKRRQSRYVQRTADYRTRTTPRQGDTYAERITLRAPTAPLPLAPLAPACYLSSCVI